jgi:RNA polymerase sigma factor for flagellar operon FliA
MAKRISSELQAALNQLWQDYKIKGSRRAREALIQHYKYLVGKTRQRIIPTVPVKIQADDLDQEGQIALVKAVDQFDIRRKVKFESYAISTVRGAMLEYLRREDWVPRSVRTKEKALKAAREAIALRKGLENVTDQDVAEHLQISLDALHELYQEADVLTVVGIEDRVGDGEQDDQDQLQVLESVRSREPDPFSMAIVGSQKDVMAQCINWLPAPERTVVSLYYYEGLTLKDIARRIERSESRAHQLHAQAIDRLKGFVAKQDGLFVAERIEEPEAAPVAV